MQKRKESSRFLSVLLCFLLVYTVVAPDFAVAQAPQRTSKIIMKTCNVGLDPVDTHRPLADDEMFVVTTAPQLITYDTGSHARGVPGANPVTCILPTGIQMAVKKDTCVVQWDRPSGNQVFAPANWVIPCHPDVPLVATQPPRTEKMNVNVTGVPDHVDVSGTIIVEHKGTVKLEPTEPLWKTYGLPVAEKPAPEKKGWCGKACKWTFGAIGFGTGVALGFGFHSRDNRNPDPKPATSGGGPAPFPRTQQ